MKTISPNMYQATNITLFVHQMCRTNTLDPLKNENVVTSN